MVVPLPESPARELQPAPRSLWGSGLLVELPGTDIPALSRQLRSLHGGPLRWRWLSDADDAFALVHLDPCPLLLFERLASSSAILYQQQTPGVWVQLGYRAPTPPTPARSEWHLLDPQRTRTLNPAAFDEPRPDYVLAATQAIATNTHAASWAVPLRLVPTRDDEPARLWLLRDDALTQLANYARTTNELLLQRFHVALSNGAGTPFAVLRATNTKGPPPVFVGAALELRPYFRMPNVYVPVGWKVVPLIRRETLRTLLGDAPGKVTWLRPTEDGGFAVESLPERAFRPLPDIVDYRAPEAQSRRAWQQEHRWELEPFVEIVDTPKAVARSVAVPAKPTPNSGSGIVARAVGWITGLNRPKKNRRAPLKNTSQPPDSIRVTLSQADRLHLARPETNSHAVERCQVLESQFLELLPAIATDAPSERWAELASAYEAIGNDADAALCWLHALWNDAKKQPALAWGWLHAEAKATRVDMATLDPEPWLTTANNPATTRALAAWVVWAAQQSPVPPLLRERSTVIHARLEADEHWLPVRAVWLARSALARQTGSHDILGLARTRDRLVARLHQNGLSVELDAPSFIRYAGDGMRERFHEARRWLTDKHELIQQWLQQLGTLNRFTTDASPTHGLYNTGLEANIAYTQAYAGLVFAWGVLRFAHVVAAETFRKQATDALPPTPIHAVLRESFEYRMQQLRDSKPTRGPLPGPLLGKLAALSSTDQYIVNKLREHSRLLEPDGHVDAYKAAGIDRGQHDLHQALQRASAEQLNAQLLTILGNQRAQALSPEALLVACERAPDINPDVVALLIRSIPGTIEALRTTPRVLLRVLERGFAACLVWDRAELAPIFANGLRQLVDAWTAWDWAEGLTGQAVRCLRRFGLKDEAEQLLNHIAHAVLQGQSLTKMRAQRPKDWPTALRVLLNVACGWYFAGHDEQAHAILDAARAELFSGELSTHNSTALAFSYTNALAYAPVRVALGRLEELFQRLKRIHIAGTTNTCFALKPLLLVETAVRVVVSDDFTMGVEVRSWLDADEFAVRRRINQETKTMLQELG